MKCEYKDCKKCGFVSKKKAKKNRKIFYSMLVEAIKWMKKDKGFSGATSMLVGSSKRNLVFTTGNDTNYDQDFQVLWMSTKKRITDHTNELRIDLIDSLKKYADSNYRWSYENSTRVITVRQFNQDDKLIGSFDVALIDGVDEKIHALDKGNIDKPIWNELKNINQAYIDARDIPRGKLRQNYLNLKHLNKDKNKGDDAYKSSVALYIEAVNNSKNN